jgi:hypothetical protein
VESEQSSEEQFDKETVVAGESSSTMRMGLEVAGESIVAVMAEIRKWVLHFSFCKIVREGTE